MGTRSYRLSEDQLSRSDASFNLIHASDLIFLSPCTPPQTPTLTVRLIGQSSLVSLE